MALDTRNRRSAATLPCLPFRAALPLPSGGIESVGDLRHLAFLSRMGTSDSSLIPARVLIYGNAVCVPAADGESAIVAAVRGGGEVL